MVFKQVDPLIANATALAKAASESTRDLDERVVFAQTAQAWALIATAQSAENAYVMKSLGK